MYDSNNFLSNKIIDHNVLHHFVETKCPKSGFHLYSLNIAQISDLRTMVIFNKINKYLKTFESEEYIKKKEMMHLFDNMHQIILKHELENRIIEEGSKQMIVDSNIINDLKELCPSNINIDYIYLRKYTPKTKSKNDELFRKRFEPCNFRYFDIVFLEENLESYENRLRQVLQFFEKQTETERCVILFQEINPVLNAYDIISQFSCFRIVDPTFHQMGKLNDKFFSKSINILLTRNFKHRISKQVSDPLIDFFAYQGHDRQKNEFQNVRYYLPKFKLYIYNIHSYLFTNKKILHAMENVLIPQMLDMKHFIIIGDLNFKLNDEHFHKLKELLMFYKISMDFKALPFSTSIYEGKIYKLDDDFFQKVKVDSL